MSPLSAPAGTVLLRQGDRGGDTFYCVTAGECRVDVDGAEVATRGPSTAFGELALLYACPRAATVTATSDAKLWALRLASFKAVTAQAASLAVAQKARAGAAPHHSL